jgi:uroporphyrinogen-III synthase
MESKKQLLSTALLPSALVEATAEHGVVLDMLPFTKIDEVQNQDLTQTINKLLTQRLTVIFTSTNAVNAVAKFLSATLPDWKIYCIGGITRESVITHFTAPLIAGTAANAAELATLIATDAINDVTFFCGNNRLEVLPSHLKAKGINIREVVVYTLGETPHKVQTRYDGILFFSPSGVKSFFSSNNIGNDTVLFAIGDTTADAIKQYSGNKIVTGAAPSKENVLILALQYFAQGVATNKM